MASAIGTSACLLATLATYWAATGTTPPWVYDRVGALQALRSAVNVAGVPIEFWGLLCFASIALMELVGERIPRDLSVVSSFAIGVVVAGVAGAMAWNRAFRTWTVDTTALASVAAICALSFERFPTPSRVSRSLLATLSRLTSSRRAYTLLLGGFFLLGVSAFSLHLATEAVPPRQAATANFLNWYSWRGPSPDSRLYEDGRVRIVAFTDYQCPSCASAVPKIEASVDRLSESSPVPIEFHIYDFPLDAACNPSLRKSLHRSACEAAAALRFVTLQAGREEGSEMTRWLYDRNIKTTPTVIREYLAARGLDEEYQRARIEMLRLVSADVEYGLRLGVAVTPSFFVNGVRMPSAGFVESTVRFELTRRPGR